MRHAIQTFAMLMAQGLCLLVWVQGLGLEGFCGEPFIVLESFLLSQMMNPLLHFVDIIEFCNMLRQTGLLENDICVEGLFSRSRDALRSASMLPVLLASGSPMGPVRSCSQT